MSNRSKMFIKLSILDSRITGTRYGDLVDNSFLAFTISFIPREENAPANLLAFTASFLQVPALPTVISDVEIKYRPSVPDNVKHWKAF